MQTKQLLSTVAILSAGALMATLAGCSTPSGHMAEHSHTNQTPHCFTYKESRTTKLNYLLHLPKDYASKQEGTTSALSRSSARRDPKFPLMLFLHGAGERGSNIWKVATHGPARVVFTNDLPFIIVSPQCPEGEHWDSELLLALLDDVKAHYAVDPHRVYLTGLSMGGYGTWDLGLSHPEEFAAIVPICGGGEFISPYLASHHPVKGPALKSLGIWAFHGAKDPVVPVDESQRMVDLVKKIGAKEVRLTVYPNAEHNSWTETYSNPELYDWLLAHKR